MAQTRDGTSRAAIHAGIQKLVVLAAVAMTVLLLFAGTLLIGAFGHDVMLNAG